MCSTVFNAVGVNLPKYKIKKPIENVQTNEFFDAWNSFQAKSLDLFCSTYAPGQSNKLKNILLKKNEFTQLAHYQKCYNECKTAAARRAVLQMVCTKFTKEQLIDTFEVSKYQIDFARQQYRQYGPMESLKSPITRSRLDMTKVEHFLNFLSNGSLLQV